MVSSSVPLAWWAVATERPARLRVSQNLSVSGPTMRQVVLQRSPAERLVLPLLRHVGARLVAHTPIGWVERRNRSLARAGLVGRVTAEQLLGAKLLLPLIIGGLAGMRLADDGLTRPVLLLLAAAGFGFLVPDLFVRAAG